VPKDKERRKKKKQEISKTVIETILTEESRDQANTRKKKRGHKDSNPASAHSCVGDNVSKVPFEQNLSDQFIFSFLFKAPFNI